MVSRSEMLPKQIYKNVEVALELESEEMLEEFWGAWLRKD